MSLGFKNLSKAAKNHGIKSVLADVFSLGLSPQGRRAALRKAPRIDVVDEKLCSGSFIFLGRRLFVGD